MEEYNVHGDNELYTRSVSSIVTSQTAIVEVHSQCEFPSSSPNTFWTPIVCSIVRAFGELGIVGKQVESQVEETKVEWKEGVKMMDRDWVTRQMIPVLSSIDFIFIQGSVSQRRRSTWKLDLTMAGCSCTNHGHKSTEGAFILSNTSFWKVAMFRAPVYTCADTSPTEKLSDVLACFSWECACAALRCKHFPLSIFPCYSLFFLLSPSLILFFITSFYHFLFLCFLMLFFIYSFYHLLLCYSLFFLIILSLSLSVFPYVILCFFLLYHLLLCYSLFFSIILSLPLSVFPYFILCFFLLSPSLMLFFVYIVLSFSLRTTSSSAPEVTSPNIAMLQLRAFIFAKHAKTRQKITLRFGMFWNWHFCR